MLYDESFGEGEKDRGNRRGAALAVAATKARCAACSRPDALLPVTPAALSICAQSIGAIEGNAPSQPWHELSLAMRK